MPGEWGKRPSKQTTTITTPAALDAFVSQSGKKPLSRLNANIPRSLHARMKAQCAMEGRDMTEVLIEILESRFPSS